MSRATQSVFADALRLEPETRAELAAELLDSLDGPADPDAEAAWEVEIERRIAAIEAGTVKLEPWETVKRRIEKEILGR
jgi:putative addiction module component (TIGR02574 family)